MQNFRYGWPTKWATTPLSSGRSVLSAALVGAGAMYFLDPAVGTRRRALIRDRIGHGLRTLRDEIDVGTRDAANRARGVVAELGSRLRADDASDRVIVARVRSELGRHTTHPHAIDVTADDGRIRLRGPILTSEAVGVRSAVARVRSVTGVDDELELHDEPGEVPGLQATGRGGNGFRLAPAARIALGSLAAVGVVAAATRSSMMLGATPLALLGAAVAAVRFSSDRQRRPADERAGA